MSSYKLKKIGHILKKLSFCPNLYTYDNLENRDFELSNRKISLTKDKKKKSDFTLIRSQGSHFISYFYIDPYYFILILIYIYIYSNTQNKKEKWT